jgi:hypothetical protein
MTEAEQRTPETWKFRIGPIKLRDGTPDWVISFLLYSSLALALTLVAVFAPLLMVSFLILSACVRRRWRKKGKDVLVVYADGPPCEERMKLVVPLVGTRAEFLNWSEKKRWGWWALAPNVYRCHLFFGPPPFARQVSFPQIYIFKRAIRPLHLSFFGRKSGDVIERLRDELASDPRESVTRTSK